MTSVSFYKHPNYENRELSWKLYKDLYEGDPQKMRRTDVLWPHQVELTNDPTGNKLRANREIRTRYFNAIEIIVSLFRSLFFNGDYALSTEAIGVLTKYDAERDITGDGKSLRQFMENEVLVNYLLYGRVWVLADNFGIHAETVAEAQRAGLRPYLESLHPLDVMDWSVETGQPARLGKLNWIRHEYELIEERTRPDIEPKIYRYSKVIRRNQESGAVTIELYRTPSSKNRRLNVPVDTEAVWSLVGEPVTLTGLSEIPVADFEGDEWLKDAVQEALRFHNLRSNHDNILYNGGYDRIFLIGIDATDAQQRQAVTEYTFPLLPAGASVTSIPPTNLQPYREAMAESLNLIFKQALNMLRIMPNDSRVAQSETSTSAEREELYKLVKSSIIEIEQIMNESLANFARMSGAGEELAKACTITLSKEICADSIEEFLLIVNAFRSDVQQNPEVYNRVLKKVYSLLGMSKEEIDALEIQASPAPAARPGAVDVRSVVDSVMSELDDAEDDEEEPETDDKNDDDRPEA